MILINKYIEIHGQQNIKKKNASRWIAFVRQDVKLQNLKIKKSCKVAWSWEKKMKDFSKRARISAACFPGFLASSDVI